MSELTHVPAVELNRKVMVTYTVAIANTHTHKNVPDYEWNRCNNSERDLIRNKTLERSRVSTNLRA